ncbi:MAG: SIMPL domain-containing protein [Candidatus Ratteibacteria bacterium]|nr:SIMPL domain-containing protein [Candidatus Ratteibacteria bacterium]
MKTFLNILCAVLFVLAFSRNAFALDEKEMRLITVTGDAEVKVVPDEVILTLGVETSNKDLNAAKNENDQKVKNIVDVAEKNRIEDKYIQTDYISIEPRYTDRYTQQEFIGYFVRKSIVITLKDISKFEDVLSNSLNAGANYVHGIQFRTTELREYRDQARALAIKAAQEKANDLAKALGQKVGKPHTIREDQAGWWSWYNNWWGSRWGGNMMSQNIVQNAGGTSETESTIELGQINVNARITVSFELE